MQPITRGLPAGGAQVPPAPQQTASFLAALVVTGPVSVQRPHVSRPLAGWGNIPVLAGQAARSGSRSPTTPGASVASPAGAIRPPPPTPPRPAGRGPRAPAGWGPRGGAPPPVPGVA